METQGSGKITIAPEVLETIARLTALAVPGVARLAEAPGVQRLMRHNGVHIDIDGDNVRVNVHVVTNPDANMLSIGHQIQTEVMRAIHDIVGMDVESVDVHIADVASYTTTATA